jgi:hypothetical protein
MDYNKVLTSTPEQVQKIMMVFDEEINILYNDLFLQISSLPRSENFDLPINTTISSSLIEGGQKRKR